MQETTDHDLLIQIKTQIEYLLVEIKSIKDDNSIGLKDHELRIRKLEQWGAMAIGGLFILELLLKYVVK